MDLTETHTMALTGETHTTEKFQITTLIQKSQTHSLQKSLEIMQLKVKINKLENQTEISGFQKQILKRHHTKSSQLI